MFAAPVFMMCPSATETGTGDTALYHTDKITDCMELIFSGGGKAFKKELWQKLLAAFPIAIYPFFVSNWPLGNGPLSHSLDIPIKGK